VAFRSLQDFGKTFTICRGILRNMEATLNARTARFTRIEWMVLITAAVGFAFDMYELVVQALVLRPTLIELGPFQPGTATFNHWAGLMLFVPTVLGGLGGLAGGYLTDRFGRQRVLVWSIVAYGTAAFMSGLSTTLWELILWRCITVAGACIEFVAAIAWLSELFPDGRRREAALGFCQAGATIGNFMIAGVYYAAVTWGDHLPEVQGGHSAWRYALIFGALPALPLMLIRPFLPESPLWRAKKISGTLRRPRFRDLFSANLSRVTIVSTALVACCYALAFGMLQHIPRVVPGLPEVAVLGRQAQEQWVSWVHAHVDMGALAGRLAFGILAIYLISRRPLLRSLLWLGLACYPLVFVGPAVLDAQTFKYAVMLVALLTAAQWSFWGNYLPRVFPLHLRGTGESFAINIGGRVIAPLAAIATTQLSNYLPGETAAMKLASSMALVAVVATICALLISRYLPEPAPHLLED
jgi:MFS family permease